MQGEYTIKEAIPLLCKSETTIRKLCESGMEGVYKYGKFWYLSKAAILKINPKAFGEEDQVIQHALASDHRFADHYIELALIADAIARRLNALFEFSSKHFTELRGDVVNGLYFYGLDSKYKPLKTEGGIDNALDALQASDLLEHVRQQFPEVFLAKWQDYNMENVNQGLIDKLHLLIRTKAFHPCDKCEACKLVGDV